MIRLKNLLKSTSIILLSFLIGILFCELILRVKHHYIINYDIEMWKYAKKLKTKVKNKKINHIHINNKSAILQNVEVSINNFGQREREYNQSFLNEFNKSFLILGSSVAMGWGVEQEKVFSRRLSRKADSEGKKWIFINGGIGNYNTERYINNYFENWSNLKFTDIVVHFFVNDTEVIESSKVNFFTNHSHLGVIVWKLLKSYVNVFNPENIEDYYKDRYLDSYEGFQVAKKELKRLSNHCKINFINCHIILMPDIHKLNPYKLKFINDKIKNLSTDLDFKFYDLLDTFEGREEKKMWNKYGDPHPNDFANKLMSDDIYNYLNK